ncbi:MAG: hypothetical protein COA97_04325 [Flavobacteriales bacterium]|nr:MAG: hypothetical protein COA97_04325 [Flavobacteriales bacterium]
MKKIISLLGIIILVVISCTKDADQITKDTSSQPSSSGEFFASINDYFNIKIPQAEFFQIVAENGGTIVTQKGSEIIIPANAFTTQNGQIVSGNITIKMKEIFSNSDIIFSGVFPVFDAAYVLNSGGEFFLEASQNGNILNVQNGQFINVEIPAQAVDPAMQLLFAGGIEDPDSVNWQPVDTATSNAGFAYNSVDSVYSCSLDSLGWINIDGFIQNITYFNCTFQLTGITGLNNSNTKAYAVFKGENAVWPIGFLNWGFGSIINNTIYETHLGSVDMNIVVFSVVDSQLYYGLLDITPTPNQTYQINMSVTTQANLDLIINGLP